MEDEDDQNLESHCTVDHVCKYENKFGIYQYRDILRTE